MAGKATKVVTSYNLKLANRKALARIKLNKNFGTMDDVFDYLLSRDAQLGRIEREQRAREKAS